MQVISILKYGITVIIFALMFVLPDAIGDDETDYARRPEFLGKTIIKNYYDGKADDLLTAGWSYQALSQRKMDRNFANLDAASLRKIAYFNNIVALIDTTENGGYGKLSGPHPDQKPVAGYEYLSYSVNQNQQLDTTLMLQIPDNFDLKQACIVVAASSGSRGIYGAVGTVGNWALLHKCAVAYTDKGTGTGFYFLDDQHGYTIDGEYSVATTENILTFSTNNTSQLKQFSKQFPTAIATKQAHSQQNVEHKFGEYVIQAALFALYQLNQHFENHQVFKPDNSLIIAASISNGGASSLRAAEFDSQGILDAVVASEPNIYPPVDNKLEIIKGGKKVTSHSIAGYDYFIAQNLYAPCALLNTPIKQKSQQHYLQSWCNRLKADGYITGETFPELAKNALSKLIELGIAENNQVLSPIFQAIKLWPALAITYTNQFGRFAVEDKICDAIFTALDSDGTPTSLDSARREKLFADSNGIPPTAGIAYYTTDPQMTAYDQAVCFYQTSKTPKVRQGVAEATASGNLNQIPTIIIHGENDSLIAPNHSSRAYYGVVLHQKKQAPEKIRYYEIRNAQHFDAFLTLPQFASVYIPLHYYFEQSLDLMMAHLTKGRPLPPSQVVSTSTRKIVEHKLEPLKLENLPSISTKPIEPITLKSDQLIVP